jgi:glycine dehydrogenase
LSADLKNWLGEITGLPAVSLQPNAGSQGELAGLLAIRALHLHKGVPERDVCLIPQSAHGTNFASAAMAGMRVEIVKCDAGGNIDMEDLRSKAEKHGTKLAALMVTYPSTHGVFEESIREACRIVREKGGRIYMDGANMNALTGLCRPAFIGADACHLNLHKTFCIPHGGGGPGMGPVCVAEDLADFLPSEADLDEKGSDRAGPVSGADMGSGCILPISWMYLACSGGAGLKKAAQCAILNANYIAKRLNREFPVLYKSRGGWVAHECILDTRYFKDAFGIGAEDIAKRLIDYGFHAPTMSWPVAGTLMVEPTESESKRELDRFCEAMLSIAREINEISSGAMDTQDNPLKNAPHTVETLTVELWPRAYSRQRAVFPLPWLLESKYWPPVSRVDHVYGDKNFFCSCPPIEA